MKLIDIEGLDGCGKATQAALLQSYYTSIGKKSTILEFPSSSPTGFECKEFQRGKFGNPLTKDPIFSSLLYTLDRAVTFGEPFEYNHLHEFDYLICDRYKMSNLICHLHKFDKRSDKLNFIDFLKTAESIIPQEDITIFLYSSNLERSLEMIKERNKDDKDLNESKESQSIFFNNAEWLQQNAYYIRQHWSDKKEYQVCFIDYYDGDNILSTEEIHKKIVSKIIQI